MYSPGIERALRAAQDAHDGQVRKGGAVPYIVHPIHAAMMLARIGADEETIQAAILHDVVEDCAEWTIERVGEEFGERVGSIVAELTEDKSKAWPERKQTAVDRVPEMSPEAATVKAADKLHNLATLLDDLRNAERHDDVWTHFTGGPARTLEMARALVEALVARVDPRLGGELMETLVALERECGR